MNRALAACIPHGYEWTGCLFELFCSLGLLYLTHIYTTVPNRLRNGVTVFWGGDVLTRGRHFFIAP